MNILVLGGAGFLGRHFAKHHLYLDHRVTAVDDMSSPYARWDHGPGLQVDDAASFLGRSGHPRYDIVYHFAAPVGGREKIEGDPLFNADSLRLDAALFRWAAKAKPRVIVYPSSSAVYPTSLQKDAGTAPLQEADFSPKNGQFWVGADEMYGFTKVVGEYLAWKAAKYGVRTLCIRPFSGYGEDQSPEYPVPSIVARARAREDPLIVWGPGTQTRDFIHVDDVVGATVARVKNGIDGYVTMNIGCGEPVSFNQLALRVASIVDYEPKIVNLADKPFGVMQRYCDPSVMLTYYVPKVSLTDGLTRMLA